MYANVCTYMKVTTVLDTHLEEEHVTQGIFGQEEKEGQNLPLPQRPTTSTASDAARKSPLKASGSSRSIRKSPLKSWNRQAGTPNNTSIDHLRANSSSVSSLKTINKSGTGKKHVSTYFVKYTYRMYGDFSKTHRLNRYWLFLTTYLIRSRRAVFFGK